MIIGLFYIFLFYFLGEVLSSMIGGFLPGSVIGMILLFLALYLKIVNPKHVKSTAMVILKNMALFFVPVSVGIVDCYGLLRGSIPSLTITIVISYVIVLATVALCQEYFEKLKLRNNGNI